PGSSILILKNAKLFLNKPYPYQHLHKKLKPSPTTNYQIPSNTKPFTPLPILKLPQQAPLNLNHPLSKHLPHFKINYNPQNQTIT
ncbi:serine hydrolase, partial [Staphylococcus aureus]|uniref:serine hydrolase n=1 Tax=Staphylococcus aureus TaxID=1280 RepID=UPI00119E7654